jgi:aspartate aminotransferase
VLVGTTASDGFALRSASILGAITPRTRGIIINSPCNPTGAVITEQDLEAIAVEARARGIWVVIDLCYEKLIYDERVAHNVPAVLARVCPDLGVICGSASKGYAMTGWRCGWAIAPAAVVAAQQALQSHVTSNVSSITQRAALAALTGSQQPVIEMRREYQHRRDQLHRWLSVDPRIEIVRPAGAFYLFPRIGGVLAQAGFSSSIDFAQALLQEARVAVTPGEAFGSPGFIRLSYATSMEALREGSRRLIEFVATRAPHAETAH